MKILLILNNGAKFENKSLFEYRKIVISSSIIYNLIINMYIFNEFIKD